MQHLHNVVPFQKPAAYARCLSCPSRDSACKGQVAGHGAAALLIGGDEDVRALAVGLRSDVHNPLRQVLVFTLAPDLHQQNASTGPTVVEACQSEGPHLELALR